MSAKSSSPAPPTASANSKKRKPAHEEIAVDLSLPEPPSKKARRALKKGKVLPHKPASDDESLPAPKKALKTSTHGELATTDIADNETPSQPKRSEYGVWIGNLYFATTQDELTGFLISNSGGAISKDNITRVKMPTSKKTGRDGVERVENKGFAYVDFDAAGPMYAAITLSETELGRRKLLIKDAKSFAGRPKREAAAPTDGDAAANEAAGKDGKGTRNECRKVYVGNLPYEVTEDDLKQHFDKCGEIAWVKVATFEDSGKCKGYGWVNFTSPAAAEWAVKGFVKIKEEELTEDDFKDKDEGVEEDAEKQDAQKKMKTRKWWVNRFMGRQLKIESAEDDQTRYKKRFGKGASGKQGGAKRDEGHDRTSRGEVDVPQVGRKREPEPLKMSDDINVARLTGGMVESKGKKITFD